MCRDGRVSEARSLVGDELAASPDDLWVQRKMGWVLYYELRDVAERHSTDEVMGCVSQLQALALLQPAEETLLYDNVLWKLASYARAMQADEASPLFAMLEKFDFAPSKAYSCLLKSHLHLTEWAGMADFIDWWNLDRLLPEDYAPYALPDGKKIMSLAEQAHIVYAKVLLRTRDRERCDRFLPRMRRLHAEHPEMTYPGYFCGKLMAMMGMGQEEVLDALVPFVREKKADFWAWQLLAECFHGDAEMRLACLLRAVHCRARESFLGKVRLALVSLYASRGEYGRARYHLDRVVTCYREQGWHVTYAVQDMLREPWYPSARPDGSDGMDFMPATDRLLLRGCQAGTSLVTYLDTKARRVAVVTGLQKRTMLRLSDIQGNPRVGDFLAVWEAPGKEGDMRVIHAECQEDADISQLPYVRRITGVVRRIPDKPFAFVKAQGLNCFIRPELVTAHNLSGGERVTLLAVYDYNKKKEQWAWVACAVC